jgi:hypothetical protein
MASDRPNYLKAAFANVYNLALVGGALTAAVATGDYVIAAAAAGLEAIWLLMGPGLRPFKRAVDEQARAARDKADRERVAKLMETLPERDWQRAKALDELRHEIERDMQNNPTFEAVLLQTEIDKLSQLHHSFVQLANACSRAETYLYAVDVKELQRQLKVQETIQERQQDETVKELSRKNQQVLKKRMETIDEIEKFLARARGQMSLIENTVRLLRDQVLTMASPNQLGEQLDDLLTGVDAVQQSVKDTEAIFSQKVEAIAPIGASEPAAAADGRTRERG